MFAPEATISHIPVTRDQLVALVEGINQPQVNIPGKLPQGCSGHLVALRNSNGTYSIFVGLHLPKSGENVIYLHQKRQLSAEEARVVQEEGLHFLESMGFMVDNLNYRNMAPEAQEATLKRIPLFAPPKGPAAAAAEAPGAAEALKVARLLASF